MRPESNRQIGRSGRMELIRVIHDFPEGRALGPVFRAGEEVVGRRIEPAPGHRGFAGWIVRDYRDDTEWALEEGRDAEFICALYSDWEGE